MTRTNFDERTMLFDRNGVLPELQLHVNELTKDLWTTSGMKLYPKGYRALMLVEPSTFDAIVAPGRMAQQKGWLQVNQDPMVKLIRDTHPAIQLGIPFGYVTGTALYIVLPEIVAAAQVVAGALATLGPAAAAMGRALLALAPRLGRLAPALASGASVLLTSARSAFARTVASGGSPPALAKLEPSIPRYLVIPNGQSGSFNVGQQVPAGGGTWQIAGIAQTI